MFAITGFYHRYFSHKAFQTSRIGQFVFAVLGATAVQRGPLWWAAHHRNQDQYEHSPPRPPGWRRPHHPDHRVRKRKNCVLKFDHLEKHSKCLPAGGVTSRVSHSFYFTRLHQLMARRYCLVQIPMRLPQIDEDQAPSQRMGRWRIDHSKIFVHR